MIVVLSSDDLVGDFKGSKKKPALKDFPALEGAILSPFDAVIYRYQDKEEEVTVVIKSPVDESEAVKNPYVDNEKSTIPKTLDEAVDVIISRYSLDDIDSIELDAKIGKLSEDEYVGRCHFGVGASIRNERGLWKDSDLHKYFNDLGIFHADDMSGIILTSVYRKIVGKDRDLEGQVQKYKDYWKEYEKDYKNN